MRLTFTYNNMEIEYPQHLCNEIPDHEARVIGTLVNDLSLMVEVQGRRNLFHTKDGLAYYDLLNDMYNHKATEFDTGSVQSSLSRLGEQFRNDFISLNGMGHLNSLRRNFSPNNFETHFEGLMKANAKLATYRGLYEAICMLHNDIETKSLEDIIFKIEDTLETARDCNDVSTTKPVILRIDNDYIQSKINGVGRGMSYNLFSISKATRGMHNGNMSMLAMPTNNGKAQPLDSLVFTKNGYVRMGDIKIGDKIYDMNGELHNVTGIFPQGMKPSYKITFKDGSTVECCDEHLWVNNNLWRLKNGKYDWRVQTLKEIMKRKIISGNTYQTFIPVNKPLQYTQKEYFIDPYIFGCLLGDGSIKTRIEFSCNELDIVERIKQRLPMGYKITKNNANNYTYNISNQTNPLKNDIIRELKRLQVFGLGSHEKFIPIEYMSGSIEQRMDLLRGLFDTDGCVNSISGNKNITTTSIRLRDDIIQLCHTLGYRATYTEDNRDYKFGKCYIVNISTYDEIFYSDKHKSRVPQNRKIKRRTDLLAITNIEYIGEKEMQCIMVDSPTHTYLTDNMIVTHNTTINYNEIMLDFLDKGEKVFIYSNESAIDDFKDMLLIRTLTKHLKYYDLTRTKLNELDMIKTKEKEKYEEYMMKIAEAQRYIDVTYNDKLVLYCVSRYSIAEFNILMRRFSHKGFTKFLIDTMKSEDAGDKLAVGKLVQQSRNIYELARKLNVHVMASYQIASYLKQNMKRIYDESCLSGSKQIVEILDILITGRELYPDEYPGQKNEIKVFKIKKDEITGKYVKEFKELESNKKYLVFFLPKNRYGAKIVPTIYQFNGEFGTLFEVGFTESIQEKSF